MQEKLKQIVIDKDAFIGINLKKLCTFAKDHLLLVCDTLLYECITTKSTGSGKLLDSCKHLIKAGAYYCSCSIQFLKWEGRNLRPYPTFLPDLEKTKQIREGYVRSENSFTTQERENILDLNTEIAKNILLKIVERLKHRIISEKLDIATNIRTLPKDTRSRMEQWLEGTNRVGLHDTAVRMMQEKWLKDDTKFCLHQEWISWQ
ncbi:MAG: hypothetical protein PVJ60_05230 [Phycisphaerales bacterium]|jgi:hypothetical protein